MDIIAIRVHHSNKNKPVYEATKAEWDEFFEKTFNTEEELLNDVLKWSKAKKVNITKQYDKEAVETLEYELKRRRNAKAKEQERIEAERLAEERRPYLELLSQNTRVQMGKLTQIAGVELFQVAYEFDKDVDLVDIDKVKEETGLTARFITFSITAEQETRYIDEYDQGSTSIDLDYDFTYTYY